MDISDHRLCADVHIPGVSSDAASTPFELAGLSLDKRDSPTRIYGVAKDHSAFTFSHQSKCGPNRFVSFPLPLTPSSKPDINIDLNPVQAAFEKQHGTWPFAPVDSTQDQAGNSYIVFALGAPAIAKVTPQGVASIFSFEAPKEVIPNRPGYTGIASIADKLVAYGGPRVLTAFDLKSSTPSKPVPVNIKGPPIKWTHAEKINAVASQDGSGDRLVVTNAPYVYSFRSTDNWQTATYKQFYRDEFRNNSLTTVTDLVFGDEAKGTLQRCIYGAGAYFGKGKFQSRTNWPLYKISSKLLMD